MRISPLFDVTIYFPDQEYMHIFLIISEKLEVLSELVNVTNQTETQACRPKMESRKNFSSYVYMYQSRVSHRCSDTINYRTLTTGNKR